MLFYSYSISCIVTQSEPSAELKKQTHYCTNYRVVRLTTPSLNYVIISGALLMYFSVFIGLLPRIEEAVIRMQCIVSF